MDVEYHGYTFDIGEQVQITSGKFTGEIGEVVRRRPGAFGEHVLLAVEVPGMDRRREIYEYRCVPAATDDEFED